MGRLRLTKDLQKQFLLLGCTRQALVPKGRGQPEPELS